MKSFPKHLKESEMKCIQLLKPFQLSETQARPQEQTHAEQTPHQPLKWVTKRPEKNWKSQQEKTIPQGILRRGRQIVKKIGI